jgi:hypothetical protein
MKYAIATDFTRTLDKFQYFAEDVDCPYCANFRNRGGHGCAREVCEYDDIRRDAFAHGRIKRKPGWFKCRV